jgi:hypothetical protein
MKAYLTHGSQIQWFQFKDRRGSIHWNDHPVVDRVEDAKKMLRGLAGEHATVEVVPKLPT